MYEQFKNDVMRRLYDKLTVEELREVGLALDLTGAKYNIEVAETHLALRSDAAMELIKMYAAAKAVEGQSKGSIENNIYTIRNFFDTVLVPPEQVKTNDIRLYLYNYKTERGISDRSLDKIRQCISAFFSWAVMEGYVEKDPATQIKKIKYEEKPRRALTQLELERLRAVCENERERMIIELLYSTGCRVSEAINIKMTEIDWAKGEIIVLGKGKKYRSVFLNAKATVAIQAYLSKRKYESEWLIASTRAPHNGVTKMAIEKLISKLAEQAGFEKGEVTPHILRHTFATAMLQHGSKVTSVQKALGHSSINTTMIYAEVDNSQVKEEIRRTVI